MNNLLNNNNKISIIANSEIRYEGTLYQINTTVIFKNNLKILKNNKKKNKKRNKPLL